jgi:hypothetical protein
MHRGRAKPGLCVASEHCANATFDDLLFTGLYRLGDLSVEPEEPDDLPAPLLVDPDEPDEPGAPDEPRDPLAPDPLDDLLLTPNAWAVLSSMVPVMVKPSDF